MPQIKPFDLQVELPQELNTILESSGISPKTAKPDNSDLSAARRALNSHGASIDDVAKTIGSVLKNSESETSRIKASEMALRVHGILQELDTKQIPNITINVVGSENKTLINLVLPT